MNKNHLLLLVFVLLPSCSKKENANSLANDPVMNEFFTITEIADIIKIVDFVDDEYCRITKNDGSIAGCYQKYFERWIIELSGDVGKYQETINFAEQQKMMDEIDPNLFNNIWLKKQTERQVSVPEGTSSIADSTYLIDGLFLNFNESVENFIQRMGDLHPQVNSYLANSKKMGTYSHAIFLTDIIAQHDKADFRDAKLRFFSAISLLAINNDRSQTMGRLDIVYAGIKEKFEQQRKRNRLKE